MVRPYEDADREELWALKRGFETELGSGTGSDEKQARYDAKLDGDYRERWLDWVDRCVAADERCVQVVESGGVTVAGGDPGTGDEVGSDEVGSGELAGYVFVLPDSLSFVWDAAVLNEIYVRPGARGTSVADDLMDAALEVARGQDLPLDRLVLDVDRENDRARAFYDRHGFDHWGELVARDL